MSENDKLIQLTPNRTIIHSPIQIRVFDQEHCYIDICRVNKGNFLFLRNTNNWVTDEAICIALWFSDKHEELGSMSS